MSDARLRDQQEQSGGKSDAAAARRGLEAPQDPSRPSVSSSASAWYVVPDPLPYGVKRAEEINGAWGVLDENGEFLPVQGSFMCLICKKHLSPHTLSTHVNGPVHERKVKWKQESKEALVPKLPWLVWMPDNEEEEGGPKSLKCLLCERWAVDLHSHEDDPVTASEVHRKRMAHYDPRQLRWHTQVTERRLQWHPDSQDVFPMPRPPHGAVPSFDTELKSALSTLPEGWKIGLAAGGRFFYYREGEGSTQWEDPSVPPPPAEPPTAAWLSPTR